MIYRQVKNKNIHTVTWVDMRKTFKVGDFITLKGDDNTRWRVMEIYNVEMEKKDINTSWRVGRI
jgi:hypothetical protein